MYQQLKNLPISLKIALAPAFAIVCLLLVAAIALIGNRSMSGKLAQVGGEGIERIVGANALATELTSMHQLVYQSLAWEGVGQRAEVIADLDTRLIKQLKAFSAKVAAAAANPSLNSQQREQLQAFGKAYETYAKVALDTLDIKTAGVATAASYVVTLDGYYKTDSEMLAAIVTNELGFTRDLVAGAQASSRRDATLMGAASVVALLLAMAISVFFTRVITTPLSQAVQLAGAVAGGDLTRQAQDVPTDATGKVLSALAQVTSNLGQIVTEVRSAANEIETASSEIASGNADLSARTESAAASLEQTAAAIEQLSASVRNSAEQAQQVNQLAQQASQVAREGGAAVQDVVQTMGGISAQSRKIGEIVGVIDGIAFQTNILALNAAVEAARAGEQGRGFAVVAQEVRTLAGRSGAAAREIRELIARSVEQTDAGSVKVQVAGDTMGRVVDSIEKVSGMVDAITRASSEQAEGIAQVNQSVSEMDRSTQQNAAMVEEAMAATESLRGHARHMVGLLTKFRTTA
jgi:methyl-accepting chemotaxis protein